MNIRVGQGSDLHRLSENLPLTIGNCPIPSKKGAVAHSDGDVLIHSIIDALLGALALGDIGSFFPDSDQEFKNISSAELLRRTLNIPKIKEYLIVNLDSTIHLQTPKLRDHIQTMRERVAQLLNCSIDQVSIKAKSGEGCDSVGKEDAIACQCTILLAKKMEK